MARRCDHRRLGGMGAHSNTDLRFWCDGCLAARSLDSSTAGANERPGCDGLRSKPLSEVPALGFEPSPPRARRRRSTEAAAAAGRARLQEALPELLPVAPQAVRASGFDQDVEQLLATASSALRSELQLLGEGGGEVDEDELNSGLSKLLDAYVDAEIERRHGPVAAELEKEKLRVRELLRQLRHFQRPTSSSAAAAVAAAAGAEGATAGSRGRGRLGGTPSSSWRRRSASPRATTPRWRRCSLLSAIGTAARRR